MKTVLFIIALISSTFAMAESVTYREVQVGLTSAYIPGGFDSESDAFVVVNGIFPNGCYSWSRSSVEHANFDHKVKMYARVASGMCLMALVPFTEEVHLGQLQSGTHNVVFENGDGTTYQQQIVVE